MLVLLALPVILLCTALHRYLAVFAPTNVLIRTVRQKKPHWQTVGLLVLLGFLLVTAMHLVAEAIADGAPGWLNVVVLILAWDAIKIVALSVQQFLGWLPGRQLMSRDVMVDD